jgi:hypothetical protein
MPIDPQEASTLLNHPEFQKLEPAQQLATWTGYLHDKVPEFAAMAPQHQPEVASQSLQGMRDMIKPQAPPDRAANEPGILRKAAGFVPGVGAYLGASEAAEAGIPAHENLPATAALMDALGFNPEEDLKDPTTRGLVAGGIDLANFAVSAVAGGAIVGKLLQPITTAGMGLATKAVTAAGWETAVSLQAQVAAKSLFDRTLHTIVKDATIGEIFTLMNQAENLHFDIKDNIEQPLFMAAMGLGLMGAGKLVSRYGPRSYDNALKGLQTHPTLSQHLRDAQDFANELKKLDPSLAKAVGAEPTANRAGELTFDAAMRPLSGTDGNLIKVAMMNNPRMLESDFGKHVMLMQRDIAATRYIEDATNHALTYEPFERGAFQPDDLVRRPVTLPDPSPETIKAVTEAAAAGKIHITEYRGPESNLSVLSAAHRRKITYNPAIAMPGDVDPSVPSDPNIGLAATFIDRSNDEIHPDWNGKTVAPYTWQTALPGRTLEQGQIGYSPPGRQFIFPRQTALEGPPEQTLIPGPASIYKEMPTALPPPRGRVEFRGYPRDYAGEDVVWGAQARGKPVETRESVGAMLDREARRRAAEGQAEISRLKKIADDKGITNDILKLHEEGWTAREIAKKTGMVDPITGSTAEGEAVVRAVRGPMSGVGRALEDVVRPIVSDDKASMMEEIAALKRENRLMEKYPKTSEEQATSDRIAELRAENESIKKGKWVWSGKINYPPLDPHLSPRPAETVSDSWFEEAPPPGLPVEELPPSVIPKARPIPYYPLSFQELPTKRMNYDEFLKQFEGDRTVLLARDTGREPRQVEYFLARYTPDGTFRFTSPGRAEIYDSEPAQMASVVDAGLVHVVPFDDLPMETVKNFWWSLRNLRQHHQQTFDQIQKIQESRGFKEAMKRPQLKNTKILVYNLEKQYEKLKGLRGADYSIAAMQKAERDAAGVKWRAATPEFEATTGAAAAPPEEIASMKNRLALAKKKLAQEKELEKSRKKLMTLEIARQRLGDLHDTISEMDGHLDNYWQMNWQRLGMPDFVDPGPEEVDMMAAAKAAFKKVCPP